eukprot:3936163-Rhodomonas_salina.1
MEIQVCCKVIAGALIAPTLEFVPKQHTVSRPSYDPTREYKPAGSKVEKGSWYDHTKELLPQH